MSPLAAALRDCGDVDLRVLATNMHLSERFGHTVDEILADGFSVDAQVPMSEDDIAAAMATCLAGCARAFADMKPDAVMMLGDRYEMLAVASAAAVARIPIIHLHGGEISEGALDDSIRHAITKLSSLHLVSTEPYRKRVIQLGEQPDMVINTGSLGVWRLMNMPLIPREDLCADLGLDASKPFAIATFHPATLDTAATPAERCRAMTEALDRFPDIQVVATYPNSDPGSEQIIKVLKEWQNDNQQRVKLIESLGMKRYASAIRHAKFVIGNSSSGIIEVPAAGVPVVNIGMRQRGRLHSALVIDCGDSADDISKAITTALDPNFVKAASKSGDLYYKPDSLEIAKSFVINFLKSLPVGPKRFYDLKK